MGAPNADANRLERRMSYVAAHAHIIAAIRDAGRRRCAYPGLALSPLARLAALSLAIVLERCWSTRWGINGFIGSFAAAGENAWRKTFAGAPDAGAAWGAYLAAN